MWMRNGDELWRTGEDTVRTGEEVGTLGIRPTNSHNGLIFK